jgi:spore germination protein YaaH
LLALAPVRSGLAQQTARPQPPLVLGYYVPYDSTSWASLLAHADHLDIVATQTVSIDACGGLTSRDDQTLKQFAHANGLKLVPSLYTLSAAVNHSVLSDDATRATAIQNIVSYTVGEDYDGFDLDLEGIDPDDRAAFSEFVVELAGVLHDQGKLLTLAVPAKERDTTTGWAGAFDYATLGAQADLITIMAYEYRGPFSGPGSVAPYDWVRRVTAFATGQIPPEKVLLGLAFYGYDWNTTSGGARALSYPKAAALADSVQAVPVFDPVQQSITFSYSADDGDDRMPAAPTGPALDHTVTTRTSPPCDVAPAPPPSRQPTPQPSGPQQHEVWFEDSNSVAARLGLADAYGARGVAAWRLGFEDPNVWPLLQGWRRTAQGN